MKIVFDSLKEQKGFVNRVIALGWCPGELGMKEATGEDCVFDGCRICWEKALKEGSKK